MSGSRNNPRTAITRTSSNILTTVFMELYKRGVRDSAMSDDPGMISEHLELTSVPGVFGYVGASTNSFTFWENRLLDVAEEKHVRKVMLRLINLIGRYGGNFLSVALRLAQSFYNSGLKDGLGGVSVSELQRLDNMKLGWVVKGRARQIDKYHIRSIVQDYIDGYVNAWSEGSDKLTLRHYEIFKGAFSFAVVAGMA